MTERWLKATRHSTGDVMYLNMSHVGVMYETKDADDKTITAVEVDQDYINVSESLNHFLPDGHPDKV